MIFWLALFAVLPFGNRPSEEYQTGNASGAPANPRIKQKFLITAVVSVVLWLIVFFMIRYDVIDFYDIAREMREEDLRR
jgi:predicted secreted protein